jgi:drug/metabolite transporter (DMT)-like permease
VSKSIAAAFDRKSSASPFLVLGLGVIAVSTASIFIRLAQQAGANSLVIAALRLTLASLILLPFALTRCRQEYRALSARDLAIAAVSGVFLGAHFATWILSFEFTSVTSSVVLVSLSPLFVALGSAIVLKERPSRWVVSGMIVAIVGGVLISLGDVMLGRTSAGAAGPNPLLGNALALAGAMCVAPYFLIGRALRDKLSLLGYVSLVYGLAAVVLIASVIVTRTPVAVDDPIAYVWILLLALVPQLVGHTSFNWALRRLPASYATIPALGEPIGSTILAILLLGEVVTPVILFGGALSLLGIAMMSVNRR